MAQKGPFHFGLHLWYCLASVGESRTSFVGIPNWDKAAFHAVEECFKIGKELMCVDSFLKGHFKYLVNCGFIRPEVATKSSNQLVGIELSHSRQAYPTLISANGKVLLFIHSVDHCKVAYVEQVFVQPYIIIEKSWHIKLFSAWSSYLKPSTSEP